MLDHLLPRESLSKVTPKSPVSTNLRTASKLKAAGISEKRVTTAASNAPVSPAPQPLKRTEGGILSQVLQIIADEVGMDKSELLPTSIFTDFGVDSLLSLNIASKLREELDLEVSGTLFAECPTVIDLARYLPSEDTSPSTCESSVPSTPDLDLVSPASYDSSAESTSVDDNEPDIMNVLRRTVAEEIGVTEEELTESLDLSELGMDSLLSLTILGRLRDQLETDLPSTLFSDNTSLEKIEAALGLKPTGAVVASKPDRRLVPETQSLINEGIPKSSSVLLQGNPKTAVKILFLFPDGSGSATSYAPLPQIAPNIAVYGLNCPYMTTPQDMKCSIEAITPRYLQEIRRRQPRGPYYFGGWSAGGICAFDAAQELNREGETVERLILIDSPFPIGLEKLPPRLYDFFKSAGVFGGGDKPLPQWLVPHFLAFVDSLDLYRATPFAPGQAPPTRLIWARDGVCKFPDSPRPEISDNDPKEMKWLLNNRTDFGSNGWDRLLSADNMVIETMDDANHFTMMVGGKAKELASFIKKAMD